MGTSTPTNGTGTGASTSGSTPSTVAATYVKGSSPAYQFAGVSQQSFGVLNTVEQLADGSVVAVNSNQLTGTARAVADVAGDADFAMGRWSKGSATTSSGTSQLESLTNGAYHYIVYNKPAAFPASGTYKCDEAKFTSPSLTNGTSSTYFAKATGTASLSFLNSVATVDLSISITAGSQQSTLTYNGRTLATPDTNVIAGSYLGSGAGMSISTAAAGNNKLRIVSAFRLIAGDSSYVGLAAFTCTPS
ncbi:hypothetical protein DBR42_25515 [Pelomonas sp. HMWF004]|nr:hypothetical protein DBR42_25515 [Pelomonas sp. HMWF004]